MSTADGPRAPEQRKADVLEKLRARHADVWVATASGDGSAHLVPLSHAWDGSHVVIALERSSTTAKNLEATGRARLALGPTRDVVMIDAGLDDVIDVAAADAAVADAYARQADWDPRAEPAGYVFCRLVPRRIQAWREADEIPGRTVMRDGAWLA